jgi:hypothetical protein
MEEVDHSHHILHRTKQTYISVHRGCLPGSEQHHHLCLYPVQVEVAEELLALDEALTSALPDGEMRLLALCSVYNAYDLSWQMEELLSEAPDLNKLANCVSMLRVSS